MATPKKVSTTTQNVGSHLGEIQFGPCKVPIGFLASFRKSSHLVCLAGKGFKTILVPGKGKSQQLCECAVARATKRLNQVKKEAFSQLGVEWLEHEKLAVAEDMERCRSDGRTSWPGQSNPYPAGSDQHIAWAEGFSEKEKEQL